MEKLLKNDVTESNKEPLSNSINWPYIIFAINNMQLPPEMLLEIMDYLRNLCLIDLAYKIFNSQIPIMQSHWPKWPGGTKFGMKPDGQYFEIILTDSEEETNDLI